MEKMIVLKYENSHEMTIPAEPQVRLQTDLRGQFDIGSRGVQISNEIWMQSLQVVQSCFLAAYNHRAKHTESSLPSNQSSSPFLAKYFTNASTPITTMHRITATHYLLLSCRLNGSVDLSFLWCMLSDTIMQHPVPYRDLLFIYPDNHTADSPSCSLRVIVLDDIYGLIAVWQHAAGSPSLRRSVLMAGYFVH